MRTIASVLCCSMLLVFLPASVVVAQQELTPEEQAELQAEYMRMAQPGEAHELIAQLEGEWEQEIRFWMSPGADPIVSTGSAQCEMILGGRFLSCEAEGGSGQNAMESLTILGYDNRHKHYTLIGFDTWGTYYVTAAGDYDPDTKTIVLSGVDTDPVMGMEQVYDMTLEFVDEDKYISAVIFKNPEMTGGAEEFKMVEVINTRVK